MHLNSKIQHLIFGRPSSQKIPTKLLPAFYLSRFCWHIAKDVIKINLTLDAANALSLITSLVIKQTLKLAQVLSLQASGIKILLGFPSHMSLTVQLVFSHLGGEKGELLFMWDSSWNAHSSAWGWTMSQSGAHGLDTEGRQTWVTF